MALTRAKAEDFTLYLLVTLSTLKGLPDHIQSRKHSYAVLQGRSLHTFGCGSMWLLCKFTLAPLILRIHNFGSVTEAYVSLSRTRSDDHRQFAGAGICISI